jgi:demethylmenaquinone methyltransferase / 2-methoxy-6-polyprenyl-1,4-benzoquinol methylase
MSDTTDFGFREVPRAEKASLVREVFDSVAPRYDLMNDLMSLGIHRVWKRIFVNAIACSPRETLLDLAGGTGDIAFGALARGAGRVLLTDVNAEMLEVGRKRALDRGILHGIHFAVVNAERIPLPDRSVPKISIAFGLRNCTDKAAVLREARRVLMPGGRFHCLEFSRLRVAPLAKAYETWNFRILPEIGARVAKDRASYEYLAESIAKFPAQPTLAAMMEAAGLERVAWRNLSGGIVAIHTGWRL